MLHRESRLAGHEKERRIRRFDVRMEQQHDAPARIGEAIELPLKLIELLRLQVSQRRCHPGRDCRSGVAHGGDQQFPLPFLCVGEDGVEQHRQGDQNGEQCQHLDAQ